MRFPRVQKIRDDKSWYECMTTTEITELREVIIDENEEG